MSKYNCHHHRVTNLCPHRTFRSDRISGNCLLNPNKKTSVATFTVHTNTNRQTQIDMPAAWHQHPFITHCSPQWVTQGCKSHLPHRPSLNTPVPPAGAAERCPQGGAGTEGQNENEPEGERAAEDGETGKDQAVCCLYRVSLLYVYIFNCCYVWHHWSK